MPLAMATGTGKTKLAIAMLYRLLAAKRFRRIAFIVTATRSEPRPPVSSRPRALSAPKSSTPRHTRRAAAGASVRDSTRSRR